NPTESISDLSRGESDDHASDADATNDVAIIGSPNLLAFHDERGDRPEGYGHTTHQRRQRLDDQHEVAIEPVRDIVQLTCDEEILPGPPMDRRRAEHKPPPASALGRTLPATDRAL